MKIVSLHTIPKTPTSHNKVGQKQQMIASGEIPHIIQFAQSIIQPEEVIAAHKHPDLYEIFLVESGNGIIQIDEKKHSLIKGMCITVEPNELHEVVNNGDSELILTYFAVKV